MPLLLRSLHAVKLKGLFAALDLNSLSQMR